MKIVNYFNEFFVTETKITRRTIIFLIVIYAAGSNLYYFLNPLLLSLTSNDTVLTTTLFAFFDISIAISMLFGGFIVNKVNKIKIIRLWAIISVIVILLLKAVTNFYHIIALICVEGILLGLSVLAFNLQFCEQTYILERGRVGAVTVSISMILGVAFSLFLSIPHGALIVLIFLSIITLTVTLFKPQKEVIPTNKISYFDKRNFLLYLIPWLIFCVNNNTFLIMAFNESRAYFPELANYIIFLRYFTAGFGALIGGFLSDKVGRKRVLEVAFTTLSLSFILFGLRPISTTFIIVHVINSFSLGILLVTFYLFLWGEFSPRNRRVLCFTIGLSILHFSNVFGFIVSPLLEEVKFETLVLLGSALLLTAILSIIFTKETLPSSQRSEIIDVKKYVEIIQRELKKIRGGK